MTSCIKGARLSLNDMIELLTEPNRIITICLVLSLGIIATVKRFLDTSGILTAGIIGLVVGIGGHWTWLATLLVFLVTGSFATRWSYEEKDAMGLAEDSEGARNWTNVLANGGAPALIAILAWLFGDTDAWSAPFLAAVAVASADTLASEFGVLDPRVRMIVSGEHVAAGTNGVTNYTDYQRYDNPNFYDNYFNGTSAAAPVATGLIALYIETNPTATSRDVQKWIRKHGSVGVSTLAYADQTPDPTDVLKI